jgi:hypothetical protein
LRVELLHDGVGALLELLLLCRELLLGGVGVRVDPLDGLVDGLLELRLVVGIELGRDGLLLDCRADRVGVVLEAVLGIEALAERLVRLLLTVGLLDHALDLRL